jgi:diguanylate cyclase (GGDEF)-like protein
VIAERPAQQFVHYCAFCGWRRDAASLTVLSPRCERCGCSLSSCTPQHYEAAGLGHEDEIHQRPERVDASATFVLVAAGPFLLPVLGVALGDMLFTIPFAMLAFAAFQCLRTAGSAGERRPIWVWLMASAGLAAVASLFAVISSVAGGGTTGAFYLGATASVALLGVSAQLVWRTVRGASPERLVDGFVFSLLIAGVAAYFVVIPGLRDGDAVLTGIFIVDLLAVLGAVMSVAARPSRRHRRVAWAIAGVGAAAGLGDALVSAGAAGQLVSGPWATALLWALAGYLVALAAELERRRVPEHEDTVDHGGSRWVWGRIVLPLTAVVSFPAIALGLQAARALDAESAIYFGTLSVLILVIAFGRQAYLLVDHRRTMLAERRLRGEAVRRSEELEALTGLATTMTESLEEAPIMERGLGVLHLAARASSSALHIRSDSGSLELRAAAGSWHSERPWTDGGLEALPVGICERGQRLIARLPVSARGHDIGTLTLVRPVRAPFTESQLGLLRLLIDQLAIAVQNARDYRDKLDQAIRDPLTGLYNRRFFYESLDKEIHRTERYGSTASVVLFDIDNFKSINDTLGHGAGDDALRRISSLVNGLLRPTDSLARLGGEEFGLLMPETQQLDALLVAERLRTAISRSTILTGRRVTVSGGVASCPKDATSHDELISRADAALYWAKRNGKNLCAIAGEVVLDEDAREGDAMIAHLHALVSTIDAHELSTKDHSENVSAYAVAIGQALGMDPEHIVRLRRAAFLHDIGKVAVSRWILEKPGPLDDAEWAEMKIHPLAGATMLLHSGLPEEALWVRHHHERLDGRGYPDMLAGEEIPVESRILFVADAFEAMTSDRPYHRGIEVSEAMDELRRCAGTQFDPRVVDALASLIDTDRLTVLAMHSGPLEQAGVGDRVD